MNKKIRIVISFVYIGFIIFYIFLVRKGIYFTLDLPYDWIWIIITFSIIPILITINSEKLKYKILSVLICAIFFVFARTSKTFKFFCISETIGTEAFSSDDNSKMVIVKKSKTLDQYHIDIYRKEKLYYKLIKNQHLHISEKTNLDLSSPVGDVKWINNDSFKIQFWEYDETKESYQIKDHIIKY